MRAGRAKIAGFLEDHACFGHGLIELYRSMRTPRWLDEARRITREAGQRFSADAEHGGGQGAAHVDVQPHPLAVLIDA